MEQPGNRIQLHCLVLKIHRWRCDHRQLLRLLDLKLCRFFLESSGENWIHRYFFVSYGPFSGGTDGMNSVPLTDLLLGSCTFYHYQSFATSVFLFPWCWWGSCRTTTLWIGIRINIRWKLPMYASLYWHWEISIIKLCFCLSDLILLSVQIMSF